MKKYIILLSLFVPFIVSAQYPTAGVFLLNTLYICNKMIIE